MHQTGPNRLKVKSEAKKRKSASSRGSPEKEKPFKRLNHESNTIKYQVDK